MWLADVLLNRELKTRTPVLVEMHARVSGNLKKYKETVKVNKKETNHYEMGTWKLLSPQRDAVVPLSGG